MKNFKFALLLVLIASLGGCRFVEDGEVGITKSFGDYNMEEITTPGMYFSFPVIRSITVQNVKIQEDKATIEVPTSDEMLVGLDVSVWVKGDPALAAEMKTRVTGNPYVTLLSPALRSVAREASGGLSVSDFFNQEKRAGISQSIKAGLIEKLDGSGIVVVDVLIRDINPPEAFKKAVARKLEAQQKVEQKQAELEQAQLDKEIERTRAEGAKLAMDEIQQKLTDRYLQYLWIQTLAENSGIEKVYIATEGGMPIFRQQQ